MEEKPKKEIKKISKDVAWNAIFNKYKILKHNFKTPFPITAKQIKIATSNFVKTGEREVRILCFQDKKEKRPKIFVDNKLFILPVKNGEYVIVNGEGYINIPRIDKTTEIYRSKLNFVLDTSKVGNSEMQYLDFAFASSLIRTFLKDDSLVLTIRGRKFTPQFSFFVENKLPTKDRQLINVKSVQTEVDAGYEGKEQIVLIEAKNTEADNVIIRQLFYPFRQWKSCTAKKVITLFFEKQGIEYSLWQFGFSNENDYNSIKLIRCEKYKIID